MLLSCQKKKKKELDKNGPKMDSSEKKCIKNQIYNNKTKHVLIQIKKKKLRR